MSPVQEPAEMHTCDPDDKAETMVDELWSGSEDKILSKTILPHLEIEFILS
jgi:hypothetical protein